tara:strand:+ start:551 stop:1342 length:792 start_codon:yes stop_codon:yes gene_type:complete
MEKNKNKPLAKKKSVTCFKNYIKKKQIDEIFITISLLFKFYFPELFKWLPNKIDSKIWNSRKFQNSMIKARSKSRKKFGKIYDTIQLSLPVKKMMTSKNIMSVIEKYTSIKKENFVCFNSVIRFDPPFDNRNSVNWHYDLYPNSKKIDPVNGVSVVVAFHDTKQEHGSPIFLLNSEKEKIKMHLKQKKSNKSDNYQLNKNRINKYRQKIFEIKAGDVLIFPMKTIHKSGKNISNSIRISGLFRYYPINKKGFTALKESYTPVE